MTEHFRVLIVDDLARIRRSLRALLATRPGLESIQEAPDAEQALELIESDCPDIVLMDVRMPGMDGLEATRRIKARWPQVKVIVLSLHTDHRADAAAAGADAFVCKCEPPERLLAALEGIAMRHS
jgi:DNA-binding NarL/FixJ family response regulator